MRRAILLVSAVAVFAGVVLFQPVLSHADDSASQNLSDTYNNTQSFDGGPGSTINTSPAANDQAQDQSAS
ncbi:MAG: hypothetical protein HQL28_02815 [Candidatus Omnitrophica bacterium]|nr:hypothetical protein [Candidatus Omnitrophota bacterium]